LLSKKQLLNPNKTIHKPMPKMILEYKKAVIKKIVDTAFEIFSTKGYQELTMDEIAKKLGVSKGALYSYFTSKDEILKEIYKNGRQILQKTLTEASQAKDFNDAIETIFQQTTEKYEKDIGIYFEILAIALHNPDFKQILETDYKNDLSATVVFIKNYSDKGQINSGDLQVSAQLFRSLWMGLAEKLILGGHPTELRVDWLKSVTSVFRP
jgi:AcrR family transcriptional regulator